MVDWTSRTIDTCEQAYIFKNFSVQRGTPRESDTASRREEACLLNLCYVVAQWVTSQPDTVDMTVTYFSSHRRLELKSDPRETILILVRSALCTRFV